MKIFLIILSVLIFMERAASQALPPIQRTQYTTNVEDSIIINPKFQTPTMYDGWNVDGTPWGFWRDGTELIWENNANNAIPFRLTGNGIVLSNITMPIGAGAGKLLTSDAAGLQSWANPAFSPIATAQDFVLEDFSSYSATTSPTFNGGFGFAENGIYTSTAHIAPREMLDGRTRNVLRLLGKGDYVRKWPWGTNWLRMRVFFVLGITNSGNNITNAFAMGVCANGTNGGFFGNAASNVWAVGTAGQASSSQTLSYSNQLDVAFFDGLFADRSVIRTNNTTVATTSGSGTAPRAYAALPHFYMHSLDLERPLTANWPTTNQTLTISYRGAVMIPAANAFVITKRPGYQSVLADAVNINNTFALQSAAVAFSSFTVNTRFFGEFDSIMFSWGSATNLAELWMAGAVKLY